MKPAQMILAFTLLALLSLAPAEAAPLGTAFTYQGQLVQNGSPVNNSADFQFTLWDAFSVGTQVAGPASANNVSVTNGQFTASIDFGSTVFNGDARWLQIAVRSPAGSGTFTSLSPRQPLTAVPYALQTRGMFVNGSGNLGIGTASPLAKLHIANGDFVAGAPGQEWYFHPRSSFGGDFLHITDNDGGVPQFQRGFVIHQNGRVGIGTSAPGEKLTVAGSMEIGTTASDYQHLRIGGGNSSGFLYGSFPHFGDGIHMGYNYYANAAGANQILAPGGGTSRVSMGYGYVALATQGANQGEPVNRFVVDTAIRSHGDHLFNSSTQVNVGAINPDPPSGTPTFPAGTPTMSAGAISMYGPAGQTRFGVWSRYVAASNTWFPNQAQLFMDAADGTRVLRIECAGEGGAQGASSTIYCTNFSASGTKNFLVPNPDDPEEDITYACLEGPECGMYVRGTAQLTDGEAHVNLPATFTSLASQEGLTVILTPLSGKSQGLACVNRSIHGFDVVELMQGMGTYEFDWEVKAIRRGMRDYQVVHPWTENAPGNGTESELWERRMADIERRNAKFAQEDAELGPRPDPRVLPLLAAD